MGDRDMTDMTVNITKLVEDYKSMRAQFMKDGQELIKKAFTEFFNQNTKVQAVAWTQYTPYFNDGEPCVFRMNGFYAVPTELYDEAIENGCSHVDYGFCKWSSEKTVGKHFSLLEWTKVKDFLEVLEELPDELFEDMFGDHTEVVATREGFEVKEHDHD